nr:MAG TPA: hypothetical protein [Caudoviricetes sp.]
MFITVFPPLPPHLRLRSSTGFCLPKAFLLPCASPP